MRLALLAVVALAATSCAGGDRPQLAISSTTTVASAGNSPAETTAVPPETSPASEVTPATTTPPPFTTLAPGPAGRGRPVPANDPVGLAAQITLAEQATRDPATPAEELPDLGHLQQVAYRQLGAHPEWVDQVVAAVPEDLRAIVAAHAAARAELSSLHTDLPGRVPAWEIIAPLPMEELLRYYREGEAAYGIPWTYLAAINLVETGLGRIRGLSIAGAQGPMQFIPTTWDAYGEGDINDPHDAILAAAHYLDARGGPEDMDRALFGYNPSDHYVVAVRTLAQLLADDEAAFVGFYNWEIHYASAAGDLWLPVGTLIPEAIAASDFVAANRWTAPPV